jgi:CubicO group peptidase (beta-lactamase class C family)
MKKYHGVIVSVLIFVLQINNFMSVCAQSERKYPKEVEARIKRVERNLIAWVQTQDITTQRLRDRMAFFQVQGLSIAVIHNYKVEWAKGYGWADTTERIPVTTRTLFQASSMGLSLHATAVLKLVQENKIDLNADINSLLTSWKFPYDSLSKNKKITIANLLSHTAGLNVTYFPGYEKGDTIPSIIQILNGQKPANTPAIHSQFEPGIRVKYSDGGALISQLIVSDVTKQPYDDFMLKTVLEPLNMTNSSYSQPPHEDKRKFLASAYEEDGSLVKGNYHTYPELAPDGLWSNPSDLCKYIIETQLSYRGLSNKILSQQNTELALSPFLTQPANTLSDVLVVKGNKYFQHFGTSEGYSCMYYASLGEDGNGAVVMMNSENHLLLDEIFKSVAIVYGWKNFYTPEFKKVVKLKKEQLASVEGKYKFQFQKGQDTVYLQIRAKDNGITITQSWNKVELAFVPASDLDFFNVNIPFKLSFRKDKEGLVTHVLALDKDLWEKVVK